jgi:16S rRNA (guanine(527)-N(7))-methyltransferase RsmG
VNNPSALITRAQPLLGWPDTDPRWSQLTHYLQRVREAGLPLVSHSDRERLLERHLIPSLEALPFVPETGTLIDVGSGGGFPAIPIVLARPNQKVICVESNSRKAAFLQRIARETECTNLSVINCRAEELGKEHDSLYSVVTVRAVTDLPELVALTRRFLAPSGCWLFWKGQDWRREGKLNDLAAKLVAEKNLSDGGRLLVLAQLEPE